jgi:hypothetical protein
VQTDPQALARTLDSVHDLADHPQLQRLEGAARVLVDLRVLDLSLVTSTLGVFERCGAQEDFGIFHTLQCYLEYFAEDPAVRAAFVASVRRAPSWKTIEMLPGFADRQGAIEILEELKRKKSKFRDKRYSADWIADQLEELRSEED